MHACSWYFTTYEAGFNDTIKFSYFNFYVFFIISRYAMKFLCLMLQISVYLTNTSSSLIKKDMFLRRFQTILCSRSLEVR